MRILVNRCFGGYRLSDAARAMLSSDIDVLDAEYYPEFRHDERILAIYDELGAKAFGGGYSTIEDVIIPDDVYWEINEYDGYESITWSREPINHA